MSTASDLVLIEATLNKLQYKMDTLFPLLLGHGLHQTYLSNNIFGTAISKIRSSLLAKDSLGNFLIEAEDRMIGERLLTFWQTYYQNKKQKKETGPVRSEFGTVDEFGTVRDEF